MRVSLTIFAALTSIAFVFSVNAITRAEDKPTAKDKNKLTAMVAALSSDQFLHREQAVEGLLEAGLPAIDAIRRALDQQDPEAAARAIVVLHELANADVKKEEAATKLLTELSLGNSPAAKQARMEIARYAAQREQRALARLRKAGMIANTSAQLDGTVFVYGVEFNDQWRGTEEELNQLRWLQRVAQVKITYPKANNQWMKVIATLPELSYLAIKRTQITDDGIKLLDPRQPLQYLDLKYVDVSDASIEHLSKMLGLVQVKLYGTKVTIEAADLLRKRLTLADIDRRDGAFLGVSCQSHPLGCEITLVSEGTAADRCGIQPGDVVVEYDGHSVADFERLTKWISHNKPGDEVPVVFVRQMEVYNFELGKIAGKKCGLEVKPHKIGMQVAKVADTSPLLTLVREKDVVFRINETRVKTVKELDAAIAKLLPDEEATIYVARDGELFERKAKLGEWE